MDTKEIQLSLANIQKDIAILQIRLLSWTVTTSEDREAVRDDIRHIQYSFDSLTSRVGLN